jgi:hypothetical protein
MRRNNGERQWQLSVIASVRQIDSVLDLNARQGHLLLTPARKSSNQIFGERNRPCGRLAACGARNGSKIHDDRLLSMRYRWKNVRHFMYLFI